jgi:hypothetical protein
MTAAAGDSFVASSAPVTSPLTTERVEVKDRILGRHGMSPTMRKTTRAVAETLFTTIDGPPPAARLDWLVDDLDDFVAQAGTRARLMLWLCLTAISVLAPLLVLRGVPFRALSLETRARALEKMEESPFALAVFGAKAILCIVYYEHPDAAALTGYDATCLVSADAITSRRESAVERAE